LKIGPQEIIDEINKYAEKNSERINRSFLFGTGVEKWLQSEIALKFVELRQQLAWVDSLVQPVKSLKGRYIREIYQEYSLSKQKVRFDIVISENEFIQGDRKTLYIEEKEIKRLREKFETQKFNYIELKCADQSFDVSDGSLLKSLLKDVKKLDRVKINENNLRSKMCIQFSRLYNYDISQKDALARFQKVLRNITCKYKGWSYRASNYENIFVSYCYKE